MDSDLLVHLCELKYIKYYILYFNDYIKKFCYIKILMNLIKTVIIFSIYLVMKTLFLVSYFYK